VAPEWTVGKRDVAKVGRKGYAKAEKKGYGRGGKKDVAKASNWAESSQWCNTNNQSLIARKHFGRTLQPFGQRLK